MLIDPEYGTPDDVTLEVLSLLGHGGDVSPERLRAGVYKIDHHNGRYYFRGIASLYPVIRPMRLCDGKWNNDYVGSFGVCDNLQQLLDHIPELEASDRKFVVTLTPVRRDKQPSNGGWRWRRWGPYIGTQNPQYEYLYDEKGVDEVLCYSIHELEDN
jgi:hypothetical protein